MQIRDKRVTDRKNAKEAFNKYGVADLRKDTGVSISSLQGIMYRGDVPPKPRRIAICHILQCDESFLWPLDNNSTAA